MTVIDGTGGLSNDACELDSIEGNNKEIFEKHMPNHCFKTFG